MRARAIPWLLALLLLPALAAAGPLDRVERLLGDARWDDAAQVARKWLERHAEDPDAPTMLDRLSEAEYQRVLAAPSVAKMAAWRAEFGDAARRGDLDSLEANLRLYALSPDAGEAAYRALAEEWPGTAAGREGLSRAEGLAFDSAKAEGTAAALSSFLGRYDGMAHEAEALLLWREAAWSEAEAADDAVTWRDLRMQDPDHPRASEALAREAARALAEAGTDATPDELIKMARRYAEVDAGWEALQRATDHALVRALDPAGTLLHEEPLGPGLGPAAKPIDLPPASRIELAYPGRLPRNATIEIALTVTVDDRPLSWERASFRQSARWGVRADPPPAPSGDTAGAFVTTTPLCQGDLLQGGALTVTLNLGDHQATWRRPAGFLAPCAGPLPAAVHRADGISDRLLVGALIHTLPWELAGLTWACDGPVVVGASGVAAVCGGWSYTPLGDGWIIGVPGGQPAPEDDTSPWLDAFGEAGWRALDVPDAWHYGGGPSCALDAPLGLAKAPAWLPEGVEASDRDLDADGVGDWHASLGTPGSGWLVVAGAGVPDGSTWVSPWPAGIDPADATVARDGCDLSWRPAP